MASSGGEAPRSVGSMGWLTESAVQPRQARSIKVDQASVVNLKATLYAAEEELKVGGTADHRRKAKPVSVVSAKTAERDSKAAQQEALEAEERVKKMHDKVALYQRLAAAGQPDGNDDNGLLVDFERKSWIADAGFVPAGQEPNEPEASHSAPSVLDQFRKTLTHVEKQMVREIEAETDTARKRFEDMQAKRQHDIEQRKAMLRERKKRKTAATTTSTETGQTAISMRTAEPET
ncbi:Uncharacterized protein PBTT_09333 [Plasmodiophora brassicae]|nr:hypothetical protein PBRA_005780 [Plasmodiophora brassicae]